MPNDDTQIMKRVQEGQLELFDLLVDRYWQPLVRVATSKLGDTAWAEDVVQETFLAVFVSRHTYKPQYPFRTWLWTILLNLCRRQLKRRANRPREYPKSTLETGMQLRFPEPATQENGLNPLLLTERTEQINNLLLTLPEVQADAIRLRFLGELKYDEIARTMNCSLGGAKLRVRNGLLALARTIRDEEGETS